MASRLERPSFFEGQYLGSADLEAVVSYARDLAREHSLAAHAWGIAAGLELVEVAAEGGGAVDLFVLPGFAWDGYGRAIVVLAPAQVPPERFAGLPSGNQQIWVRYDETPFRGLREGFETCGADEAFSRVRESFAIEVGPFTRIGDRQSGITVAGQGVADARLVGQAFDADAPMLVDGSVPHPGVPGRDGALAGSARCRHLGRTGRPAACRRGRRTRLKLSRRCARCRGRSRRTSSRRTA